MHAAYLNIYIVKIAYNYKKKVKAHSTLYDT